MPSVTIDMQANHRHCDSLFAEAENLVSNQLWDKAASQWQLFAEELRDHIDNKEEGILFPAIESITGPIGPIMVMKQEHQQMRNFLDKLNQALEDKNKQTFLEFSESLMILIQQHNMKEEQILYPLIDQNVPNATTLI